MSSPTALVTGASRGLGRALTDHLVSGGWRVVVDARHPADLTYASDRVTPVPGDVTDPGHRRRLAEVVDALGGLDLLVNNAGVLGPSPQRFTVPAPTARLVNGTAAAGGRVVAVGTTVVRAVETAADPDGTVRPAAGWTDIVLGPDRPARAVTGLVTGLHAPEASHLLLLEAVAGADLVGRAYAAAVAHGDYLWHEFGDSTLFLPDYRVVSARR